MRRWLWYVFLGLALYLMFLVATAPAGWVSWALARTSRGEVNIARPSGTVWRGRGILAVRVASALPRSVGSVRWEFNPLWLFLGRLRVHTAIDGSGANLQADIDLGYHRIALSDLNASFPAQLLSSFYSPAGLFGPAGQFHVDSKRFAVRNGTLSGRVAIEWQRAASSLSSVRPLGDYRLYLEGHGRSVALRLQTLSGSLGISGTGQWEPATGTGNFNGMARPNANSAALEPVLRMFGPTRGNGMRTFDWQWNTGPLAMDYTLFPPMEFAVRSRGYAWRTAVVGDDQVHG